MKKVKGERKVMAPPPSSSKRLKEEAVDDNDDDHVALIPGLPDHLSHLCLSKLPHSLLFSISLTCRRLLYSPCFPPFLSLYIISSKSNDSINYNNSVIDFSCFDPISSTWSLLPCPPNLPPLLLSHPSFISRTFPIQSSSTCNHLFLISATSPSLSPAFNSPFIFHPLTSSWLPSPPPIPLSPRRWCALGSDSSSSLLYLASGIASHYSSQIARSFHRFNPFTFVWETLPPLKDGFKFSREPIEIVASDNKLCIVNSAKEGAVYDIGLGEWVEMPIGLLQGWGGAPVAVEGDKIYVVDAQPHGSLSGRLKRYDWEKDIWTVVMESDGFRQVVAMAGGGGRGKICVICNCNRNHEQDHHQLQLVKVVDVIDKKIWTVPVPEGKKVLAMHVLPRMPIAFAG